MQRGVHSFSNYLPRLADPPNRAEGEWVCRTTDLKVEVRTGRFASRAHIANELTLVYRLTYQYNAVGEVCIQSLCAIAVCNSDIVTVAAIPRAVTPRNNNRAGRRRVHRRTARRAKINTIPPMYLLGKDRPRYWVYEET